MKLQFSPKGKSVYVVGKFGTVQRLSLLTKHLNESLNFEVMFSVTEFRKPKFVGIVPYDKSLYVIRDSSVFVVVDKEITQVETLEVPVTACCCVSREIALKHSIIDSSVVLNTIAIVGDEMGRVSRMSFPNTLVPIESLSSPFVSKSEPIAHIVVDSDHFIVAGRNGTVTTGTDIEGCVSHPITSLSVQGDHFFFVSNQRLFLAPIQSPSGFHAATKFTSRIACANGDWVLTTSGIVTNISAQNTMGTDPRPQYIEYALNKLRDISDEYQRLQRDVVESESLLDDLQLLRALKSGIDACKTELTVTSTLNPDGRVSVNAKVCIEPREGYSCRGCSVNLVVQNNTFATETICLPKLTTDNCNWIHELPVVSPQPLNIEVAIVNSSDAFVVATQTFDILDCSAEVDPSEVCVGKLSPIHMLLPMRPIASLQFTLIGELKDSRLFEPKAFVSATGEHWTVRIDGSNCTVSAGTEATAMCAMNAVLRRLNVSGSVNIGKLYETSGQIQEKAEAFATSLEHETSLMRSTLVNRAREFQLDVQTWTDMHLM